MKKFIVTAIGFLSLVLLLGGVIFGLPNELHFKVLNNTFASLTTTPQAEEKTYKKAQNVFPKWEIIAQNNRLGGLYKNKQYKNLQSELQKISQKKCSLKNEKISEFCANIFYLEGLTHYQLGKELESKKQKPFFEEAILAFQKVMIMNNENSQTYQWSKENIEFLQKKFKEIQKKEQQKNQNSKNKKDNKKQSTPNKKNKPKKSDKNTSDSKQANAKQQNNEDQKKLEENKNTQEQSDNKKDSQKISEKESDKGHGKNTNMDDEKTQKPMASRLPQEIQTALEQVQKQIEADQQNSQKGFNRSKSAAEKNNLDQSDPFSDPFFQDFFGNNPFFSNPFGKKKFHKNITNSNEKDW